MDDMAIRSRIVNFKKYLENGTRKDSVSDPRRPLCVLRCWWILKITNAVLANNFSGKMPTHRENYKVMLRC